MSNEKNFPILPERKLRRYYSERQNGNAESMSIEEVRRWILIIFKDFRSCGYFTEAFGDFCVDRGGINGTVGDPQVFFKENLGRPNLWPIEKKINSINREEIFDLIEILYDLVSKPIDGFFHGYDSCGWHFENFSKHEGQKIFSHKINGILRMLEEGYQLDSEGFIIFLGNKDLSHLMTAEIPSDDAKGVVARIDAAILSFKSRQATLIQRRDAIRNLADILEYLRPKAVKVFTKKDENDLFRIINNFGIRHHNQNQQTDYDEKIWLSWMFYFYLSTIHALLRFIEQEEKT